ncbi:MAG: hypothetical protein GWP08_17815 [Nitrospiraceae bacterium]|nr:hypothetical protein [Nitrospiraceae bacterium]
MWKANWEETKQHFTDWWRREGLVVGMWGAPWEDDVRHEELDEPAPPASIEDAYANPEMRAIRNHHALAHQQFPADAIPVSNTDIGPGSLALLCGSTPGFANDTVWFNPCIADVEDPETLPPLRFDAANRWWQVTEATLRHCARLGRGKYLVGCPDYVENFDVLASLRDAQTLLLDLIGRPDWVRQKIREINEVWFEAYQRTYDIIKQEDGGAAFGAFRIWGPGKTAKLQCDASAMISPEMFDQFVVPALAEQCEWLDYSMYHLDGTQAMCHLDALLGIEALDAIEWTPQAGIEGGGHPRWYPLYTRILDAGKSLQVIGLALEEVASYRSQARHLNVALLTATDADQQSVAERRQGLADSLRRANLPEREKDERIALWIPKWNIETWLLHLTGHRVTEDKNYKQQAGHPDYNVAAARFVSLFHGSGEGPSPLPALEAAFVETQRIRKRPR